MKIMLVGGAGFIGSHLAKVLLGQGHEVSIVDNFTNYDTFDADTMAQLFDARLSGMHSVATDIVNFEAITDVITKVGPEVIVHLAAYPNARLVDSNPAAAREVMIDGLQNTLLAASFAGVRRFVFVSSSMVYGNFEQGVTENAPTQPMGAYGMLKLQGELMVKEACRTSDMEYTIVRPIAVYGPFDTPDRVVAKFLSNAIHNDTIYVQGGKQILDLTYVTDTAYGISLAATKDIAADQTYNINLGVGYSLSKVAIESADATHSSSIIHCGVPDPVYPTRNTMSNAKAKEELGFEPTVTLHNGLTAYASWLTQNPVFRTKPTVPSIKARAA